MLRVDQPGEYVIKVRGCLDRGLVDSGPVKVAGIAVDTERGVTTLSGIVADQAGVVGLIRQLHGLGVVLLVVERVPGQGR